MYSNNPECLTQTINQLKVQYTTCTSTLHLHTNSHPESLLDLNYNLPQLVSSMRPCWQANKWTNKRAIPYFMSYHRKIQWWCVRLEHNRKKNALQSCFDSLSINAISLFIFIHHGWRCIQHVCTVCVWITEHVHVIPLAIISSLISSDS